MLGIVEGKRGKGQAVDGLNYYTMGTLTEDRLRQITLENIYVVNKSRH